MRTVLVIVACVVAANLGLVLALALQDVLARRKRRREIARLDALFDPPARPFSRASHGRTRLANRAQVAAAVFVVLSGVAMAHPSIRDAVVATADRAAGVVAGDREPGATPAEGTTSPSHATDGSAPPDAGTRPDAGRDRAGSSGGSADGDRRAPGAEPAPTPAHDPASPSASVEVVPSSPPAPSDPPEPTDTALAPTAEPTSPTTVVVSWNRVPTAKAYSVTRAIAGSDGWVEVEGVSAGKRSVVSADLQPGTTYRFRVTATLAGGGEQVAEAFATTPAEA